MWLKEGDRNTRFFHGVASRRNNMILRIKDDGDIWHDKKEELEEVFLSYFSNIFSMSNGCYFSGNENQGYS